MLEHKLKNKADINVRLLPFALIMVFLNIWLSHVVVTGETSLSYLTLYSAIYAVSLNASLYIILWKPANVIIRTSLKKSKREEKDSVHAEIINILSFFVSVALLIGIYVLTNHFNRMI